MLRSSALPRSIHVRIDDESDAALGLLRSQPGVGTDSEAVRRALRDAGERLRGRASLREEAAALAADPADLDEARAVRELLDELAPERG